MFNCNTTSEDHIKTAVVLWDYLQARCHSNANT